MAVRIAQNAFRGLVCINKPYGVTSSQQTQLVKDVLAPHIHCSRDPQTKRRRRLKVGHGGTLDPFATGVLVIGVGKDTKRLHGDLLQHRKVYRVRGRLGVETDTYDFEGKIVVSKPYDHVTAETITKLLDFLPRSYNQIPPQFSARTVDGVKLYHHARHGTVTSEMLETASKGVEIYDIKLLGFQAPFFDIEVAASRGFYVRSLIRDIGVALGSVATMAELIRVEQCGIHLGLCLNPKDITFGNIQKNMSDISDHLDKYVTSEAWGDSLDDAVKRRELMQLNAQQREDMGMGKVEEVPEGQLGVNQEDGDREYQNVLARSQSQAEEE